MRLSDGAIVPGNARIGPDGVAERLARFYDPYDHAIDAAVAAAMEAGAPPAIVTVHSFTPAWRGVARPWQVGILWDRDDRLAGPLIAGCAPTRPGSRSATTSPMAAACRATRSTATPWPGACPTP